MSTSSQGGLDEIVDRSIINRMQRQQRFINDFQNFFAQKDLITFLQSAGNSDVLSEWSRRVPIHAPEPEVSPVGGDAPAYEEVAEAVRAGTPLAEIPIETRLEAAREVIRRNIEATIARNESLPTPQETREAARDVLRELDIEPGEEVNFRSAVVDYERGDGLMYRGRWVRFKYRSDAQEFVSLPVADHQRFLDLVAADDGFVYRDDGIRTAPPRQNIEELPLVTENPLQTPIIEEEPMAQDLGSSILDTIGRLGTAWLGNRNNPSSGFVAPVAGTVARTIGTLATGGAAGAAAAAVAEGLTEKKRRRRRPRLATPTEVADLTALKSVLGNGEAFKTWIATRRMR